MKSIRIAFAALFVIPILLLSILYAFLPASLLRAFGRSDAAERHLRRCGHFIGNSILFFLGVTVHVDGRENLPQTSNICYMGNHQSLLDIVAFVGPADLWAGIIAKVEVKKIPIINLWSYALGCIFIDRVSPHDAIKAILKGVQHLKDGKSLLVFPEGTRSKSGKIGELKNGSLKLATRSKAVIVPFTVKGLRAGFENLRGFRRVHAYFSIGKAIATDQLSEEALAGLHEVVYGAIAKRFDELPGQV
ncbi:MAG: lysophospholipid acyltransferase family protein [Sphaerochaeta sp.]|jgi:1-acyl-sn-glycerol-3-phosphate acyltransferase|uniref:lysophospholipid acyltransferase family protein n=1 Tax=Sphaerochaeta sp. TaxID=1972642 RepID=UPI003D0E403A